MSMFDSVMAYSKVYEVLNLMEDKELKFKKIHLKNAFGFLLHLKKNIKNVEKIFMEEENKRYFCSYI